MNKIWPEYHKYIDSDSTERIKWLGDLDVLKQFVRNLFGDVDKWSSPGGFAKAYYYKQSDITWYTNNRSLHFHGKDGIILKNLLTNCDIIFDKSNVSNTTLPNNQSNIDNANHCGKCHDYRQLITDMADLRSKFEILFEKTEHLCTFVSNVLPSRADDGEIKATSECATQHVRTLNRGLNAKDAM